MIKPPKIILFFAGTVMAKLNALMNYNGLKSQSISFSATTSPTVIATLTNIVLIELEIRAREAGSSAEYAGGYKFEFDEGYVFDISAYVFSPNYSSKIFGFTLNGLTYATEGSTDYIDNMINTNLHLPLKKLKISTVNNNHGQTGNGTIYIKYYQL